MKILNALVTAGLMLLPGISGVIAGNYEDAATDPVVIAPLEQNFNDRYWGLNLGYAAGSYEFAVHALNLPGIDVDVNSAVLGARYGRNFQSGRRVFGYDVELSSGPEARQPQGTGDPTWYCESGDCSATIDAMLSVRGRYGFVLGRGKTMVYGAAGITVARYQGGIENSPQYGPKNTATGYNVALGLERVMNARTSIYGEIIHTNLGTLDFGQSLAPGALLDGVGDFRQLRVGVNFKF